MIPKRSSEHCRAIGRPGHNDNHLSIRNAPLYPKYLQVAGLVCSTSLKDYQIVSRGALVDAIQGSMVCRRLIEPEDLPGMKQCLRYRKLDWTDRRKWTIMGAVMEQELGFSRYSDTAWSRKST